MIRKEILLCIIFLAFSCKPAEKNNKAETVFNDYLKSLNGFEETRLLKKNLKDSVNLWIDKGLYYVLFLKKTHWVIDDAIFFNKKRDKALLILLLQPNEFGYQYDYSKIVAAEKINGLWMFYYASYPVSLYERKYDKVTPFDTISKEIRRELINDGFIICNPSCKINYHYVESETWFKDWMRKMHQKFLDNSLSIHPLEKPGDKPY